MQWEQVYLYKTQAFEITLRVARKQSLKMMKKALQVALLIICVYRVDGCVSDASCKIHEVCCKNQCKTWPACFLNTNKECFYDTHCVKGSKCVKNACIATKAAIACSTRNDCLKSINTSKTIDCCEGRCIPRANCSKTAAKNITLKKTKAQTSPILVSSSCRLGCPSGFICINKTCHLHSTKRTTNATVVQQILEETPKNFATGILSAALFGVVVFFSFVCICFLRETKYYRRICSDIEENTSSSCPRHQRVVSDRNTVRVALPSYSLFSQPPPTYEEATRNFNNTKS